MHDIWNPWHGCIKVSEGCQHCYMYYLDKLRGKDAANIYKTKTKFNYPLQKSRDGSYKVKSGEMIRIGMSSDFFIEEADKWRTEVWDMIRLRSDVKFFILTKRIDRAHLCLPDDWQDGYDNVIINVSCENQKRADERIPILLELPAKHKGIMCAPMISAITIKKYLKKNQLEQVICGGENYDGLRPCDFDWVKSLQQECVEHNVKFCFIETGTHFIKDGKHYLIKTKARQIELAYMSKMNFEGKPIEFKLVDSFLNEIPKDELYKPYFMKKCYQCASKPICNGCSRCKKCRGE